MPQPNFQEKDLENKYKYGFTSKIDQEVFAKGLDEEVIQKISKIQKEPEWLLDFRLKAYKKWLQLKPPTWSKLDLPQIDFQDISYFAKPKKTPQNDLEIQATFQRLGVPIAEQKLFTGVAVDAVLDSVSVATTFGKDLEKLGIIFCSISEASRKYPDLVQKYLGSVVPFTDNFFACLNSAVFSDGTFVFIPKNTRCPIDLSTYFRINSLLTGQFERTLIVCESNSFVSYLEGCTAPIRKNQQLHSAVVELVALDDAQIKYSTVQNWYAGDKKGKGGILNYVTKRGKCVGKNSKISWTQVEVGSSITWKYPSVILKGEGSRGEFLSLALTKDYQQADTGTKMIHIGKNTKSKIISKSISAGNSKNIYRGLVDITKNATGSHNYTQCDSLILSQESEVFTYPNIQVKNNQSFSEHEAFSSSVNQKQIQYLNSRGLDLESATSLIITGNTQEIFSNLPLEFVIEAKKLLELKLEGSVG